MKKLLAIILFVAFIIGFAGVASAEEIVSPTEKFYINDFANVLSDEVEQHIFNVARKLNEDTKTQVVVVTVETVGNADVFQYSLDLARKWGIGDKEKNTGCLIFLSIKDRKSQIQVGYGLEGFLTDSKTGTLQDTYLIPYLKKGEYDNGIKNLFDAVVTEVYKEHKIAIPDAIKPQKMEDNSNDLVSLIIWIIISLFIVITYKMSSGPSSNYIESEDSNYRRSSGSDSDNDSGGGGFGGGGSGRSW